MELMCPGCEGQELTLFTVGPPRLQGCSVCRRAGLHIAVKTMALSHIVTCSLLGASVVTYTVKTLSVSDTRP
jgi:hypothetical protein